MRIIEIRPSPPGADGRAVAHFDIEISPDVRLFGLRLIEAPSGHHLVYAANFQGRPTATFSREFASSLSRAACAALREGIARDRNAAA